MWCNSKHNVWQQLGSTTVVSFMNSMLVLYQTVLFPLCDAIVNIMFVNSLAQQQLYRSWTPCWCCTKLCCSRCVAVSSLVGTGSQGSSTSYLCPPSEKWLSSSLYLQLSVMLWKLMMLAWMRLIFWLLLGWVSVYFIYIYLVSCFVQHIVCN